MEGHFTIRLDGNEVEVEDGQTLLEVLRGRGIEIPTLCHHDQMTPAKTCRLCVVEVEGARTLVASCERLAEPGMSIRTASPAVLRARRGILELLLGEVDSSSATSLEEYARRYGAERDRYPARRPGNPLREENPLFVRDDGKCILCYRCVEACGWEVQNVFAIAVAGRGETARIASGYDLPLAWTECVFCGNCVGVCPTGALMDRTEYERRQKGMWQEGEFEVVQTTCPYCGVGCQLELHVDRKENTVVKVTSPETSSVSYGNLCIKGRYGYGFLHPERDGEGAVGRRPEAAG